MSAASMPQTSILKPEDIRQFQPAALEVEQTPANPMGRAILWAVMALFSIAVVWAWFGHIDIVVSAPGKIIPSERVKQIQALESAPIAQIHVRDGQSVTQGQVLVTLDRTATEADVRRLSQQLTLASSKLSRASLLADWLNEPFNPRTLPTAQNNETAAGGIALTATERQSLIQEAEALRGQWLAMQQEGARLDGEEAMAKAEGEKARRLTEVLHERVKALESLANRNMGSRAQFLELKQDLIEVQQNQLIQIARLQQLEASLESNRIQQQQFLAENRARYYQLMEETQAEKAALTEELIKARQRSDLYEIKAPINGTVQALQIHTLGGVVTPAQVLMQIVPADSQLEVEATILNKDIGFVQEGQIVEVKVDAFNFTKYGVIEGTLLDISDDALLDEQLGWIYKGRILLDQEHLIVEGKEQRLSPGMSISAEVKTGERRLLEYFLSPLLRKKEESLGER